MRRFNLADLSITRLVLYIILLMAVFVFLVPIWGALTTGLKSSQDVATTNPLNPAFPLDFQAYPTAFARLDRPIFNSLIIAVSGTILSSIFGSLTAFSLNKTNIHFPRGFLILVAFGTFLPYQAVLIPLVRIISNLNLYDTLVGLILAHTAYGTPVTTVFFVNHYREISDDLIDAAKVDGAGNLGLYLRIILPLSAPGFVVAGIYQFVSLWNDYLFGLVLTRGESSMPATVALANLRGSFVSNWSTRMAGAVIVALPPLLVFIFLGRQLMRGYTSGGVKG